jgi:hypothetical protein
MVSVASFHLAQVNIGRLLAPIDDPLIADFVAQLDAVNALADASPGFVWRLKDESGNATAIPAFDDPRMIINMSVWESLEALRDYAYRSDHSKVLTRRREWFEKLDRPHFALWWIPAGTLPTVEEAKRRLEILAERGPTPDAFTFRDRFPAPVAAQAAAS